MFFVCFNVLGCVFKNVHINHLNLLLVSDLGGRCLWKEFEIYGKYEVIYALLYFDFPVVSDIGTF